MNKDIKSVKILLSLCLLLWSSALLGQKHSFPLNSTEGLQLINVKGTVVQHKGKSGLLVTLPEGKTLAESDETLVIISDLTFTDGTIELELAGDAMPGAPVTARGFVGMAFRMDPANQHVYECIYLRPKNGRAATQLQRNHSVQYTSHPDYPWHRLRKESPGVYESYVDLLPAVWTKYKIDIQGTTARLYVHGAEQPTLLVNDLKRGEVGGGVALWLYRTTKAHFRNLVITVND